MRAFVTRLLHFARRRRYLAIWSAGLLVIALVVGAAYSPFSPLDRLNYLVFDTYQKLKPREATESAVAVVDIDDESIRQLGQWPWSRTVLASVIDRLAAEGAAAIGLDIILSEPDRTSPALAVAQLENQGFQITYPGSGAELDHDKILAASFAKAPVVAGLVLSEGIFAAPPPAKGGFAFAGDNPAAYLPAYEGAVRNLPILDEAAPGLGVFSFPPAEDGVVRQIPLISRHGENLYPALSIESLRLAQGASGFIIRSTGASTEFDTGHSGMTALKVGALEIPTGPDGRIWVYYSREPTSPVIPVHRLLGEPDPELRGLIAACLDKDPNRRPTPADLVNHLAADAHGTAWLPGTIAQDLTRRATTAPPLPPAPQYAPWGRRVAATVIDALCLLAAPIAVLAVVAVISLVGAAVDPNPSDGLADSIMGWLVPLSVAIGYLGMLGIGLWLCHREGVTGQTPGKRLLGIRLQHADFGTTIGFGKAFLRRLAHILDSLPCYIGYLWPLWDRHRQTFADKLMTTAVVSAPRPTRPSPASAPTIRPAEAP
jgi:adenylate cyclase